MEEKWSIDFKKFKKNSSKKLLKTGLGFFLSPREEKDSANSSGAQLQWSKKTNTWENENLNPDLGGCSGGIVDIQNKDYTDDIPTIPSLDDVVDEDSTIPVAKAPLVGVKQVASYKELENDLLKHSAFGSLEEMNLQVLIKLLHPASHLDEPDTQWTKDGLFNEVVSIFNERKN